MEPLYILLAFRLRFRGRSVIDAPATKKAIGYTVTADPALPGETDALLALLDAPEGLRAGRVIKSNMVRTVYEVDAAGTPCILKRYHSTGLVNAFKYLLFATRAATEWSVMRRFNRLGIPTATPLAFGEKRRLGFLTGSFFAATVIANSRTFLPFVSRLQEEGRWSDADRKVLYGKLADLTARLHGASAFHADYHLGNVLVRGGSAENAEIFIIDLHTVTFPPRLGRRRAVLNLARVAEGLRSLGSEDVGVFLEHYVRLRPGFTSDPRSLEEEVGARLRSLDRRKLRSRTRRCLVRSSEFKPARGGGYRINMRRSFAEEDILEAVRVHDAVPPSGDSRLIPPSNKNKITVIDSRSAAGPARLCLKEYRKAGALRRILGGVLGGILHVPSEGRRSWVAGRALEVRGIATPETVAWLRGNGREFIMTRFLEGARKLHEFSSRRGAALPPDERGAFLKKLAADTARFVRRLHDTGVRHRDLCEQNILVREEGGKREFFLTDLDTVVTVRRLGERRIVKNLVQLGHLPGDVDVILKARFLRTYLAGSGDAARRRLFRIVDRGVLGRMQAKRKRFLGRGAPDPHPVPSALRRSWSGV